MLRQKARATPGVTSAAARRLADAVAALDSFRDQVFAVAREIDALRTAADTQALDGLPLSLRANNLKLAGSRYVVDIVHEAMSIGGIASYKNDSPYSLGRNLRDAHSAAVMVNNDRLREINASMLLVHKGD
jgi:acyl-CoA dehydrogenase